MGGREGRLEARLREEEEQFERLELRLAEALEATAAREAELAAARAEVRALEGQGRLPRGSPRGGPLTPPPGFLVGPAGGDSGKWRERYEKAERALEGERTQSAALRRELRGWEERGRAVEAQEAALADAQGGAAEARESLEAEAAQARDSLEAEAAQARESLETEAAQARELAAAVQGTVEMLLEENDGLVAKLNRQSGLIEELQGAQGGGAELPPDITPDDFLALAAEVERLRALEDAGTRRGGGGAGPPSGGGDPPRPLSPAAITPTGNPSLRVQIPPPLHAGEGDSDGDEGGGGRGDGEIAVEDDAVVETEVYVRRRLGLWGYIVGADRLP